MLNRLSGYALVSLDDLIIIIPGFFKDTFFEGSYFPSVAKAILNVRGTVYPLKILYKLLSRLLP